MATEFMPPPEWEGWTMGMVPGNPALLIQGPQRLIMNLYHFNPGDCQTMAGHAPTLSAQSGRATDLGVTKYAVRAQDGAPTGLTFTLVNAKDSDQHRAGIFFAPFGHVEIPTAFAASLEKVLRGVNPPPPAVSG